MSGHSKWANIKHRKGRQDAKRGKVFTRIAKEITIAARDGGGDPEMNPRLRLAIASGRAVNMPNDNITRAIKKGTGELEGASYEEITYEGYAPNGVAVVIECVTDNRVRTIAEIRAVFNKRGGNIGETNSVMWNFDQKGVFTINTKGKTEDELFEMVIEAGAEDLEYDEESSRVICSRESFSIVNQYLNANGYEVTEGKLEYIASNVTPIDSVEAATKVMKFTDAMEDLDDVQYVYSNAEIPDEIMESLDLD
ncbi:MAG: YebC/PmpR family DNA-binding transcriptional regulator [Candidatus Kapabacteria bacterium]|nr:YebC/PmpR family DNA-binding transcriptional regulator [Candidatus Kapabacteria bacterium]